MQQSSESLAKAPLQTTHQSSSEHTRQLGASPHTIISTQRSSPPVPVPKPVAGGSPSSSSLADLSTSAEAGHTRW